MDLHVDTDATGRSKVAHPVTLLVYLDGDGSAASDGATVLSRGHCKDLASCCRSTDGIPLHVRPKVGRALLIWSHTLDGKPDPTAAYGSCSAGPHGKWVARLRFL